MLLCINGLSDEKVGAIVELYPTPVSLYSAFREAEERESFEERERQQNPEPARGRGKKKDRFEAKYLLAKVARNPTRPIGQAVSARVYEVMMAFEYD